MADTPGSPIENMEIRNSVTFHSSQITPDSNIARLKGKVGTGSGHQASPKLVRVCARQTHQQTTTDVRFHGQPRRKGVHQTVESTFGESIQVWREGGIEGRTAIKLGYGTITEPVQNDQYAFALAHFTRVR